MGQDVVYSQLLTSLFSNIQELHDLDISISKTQSDYHKENIEIEISEMATPEITELVIS